MRKEEKRAVCSIIPDNLVGSDASPEGLATTLSSDDGYTQVWEPKN